MYQLYLNKISESFDNLFTQMNNNKNILIVILILILSGIYYTHLNDYDITKKSIDLSENDRIKFLIFIIIICVSNFNMNIGVILAIIMLVSLQLVTSIKINKELNFDINDNTSVENK